MAEFTRFLFTAIVLFFSALPSFAQEAVPPVKVGVIVSLSGDLAPYGTVIQKGMNLAARERANLKLQFADDQSANRTAALSAAQQLINVERVPVILNGIVNTVAPIAPLLNSSKTLGVVVWDSNKTIAQLGQFVFGFGYSTELAGEVAADYANQTVKAKKVYILSAEDEWSELISNAFEARLRAVGVATITHDRISGQTEDLRPFILRARTGGYDLFYAPLFGRNVVNWIKDSHSLHYSGVRMTGDGISDYELSLTGSDASNGLIAVLPFLDNHSFFEKFRTAYGETPSGVFLALSALGYDSVNCVSDLVETLQSSGREVRGATLRETLVQKGCRRGLTGALDFSREALSSKRERVVVARDAQFVESH